MGQVLSLNRNFPFQPERIHFWPRMSFEAISIPSFGPVNNISRPQADAQPPKQKAESCPSVTFPDSSTHEGKNAACLREWLPERLDRCGLQLADSVQDKGEHLPGFGHLGQLKEDVSGIPHNPAAHFDQLPLQAPQLPVLEAFGQRQPVCPHNPISAFVGSGNQRRGGGEYPLS